MLCFVQMHQEKFDFFPLNRALSLSAMDEDSTESKVDDLLRQVNLLVERQREEVTYLFIYLSICLFIYLFIYLRRPAAPDQPARRTTARGGYIFFICLFIYLLFY